MTLVWVPSLVERLLAGSAGLFTRYLVGSIVYVLLVLATRSLFGPSGRAWFQIALSVMLVTLCTTPLLTAVIVLYAVAFWIAVEQLPAGGARRGVILAMLIAQVTATIVLLPHQHGMTQPLRVFLAFSSNLFFLRSWAWAFDQKLRSMPLGAPERSFRDYAFYMFFFPGFVSGPFFSPSQLNARRLGWYWEPQTLSAGSVRDEAPSLVRIAYGLAWMGLGLLVVPVLSPAGYQRAIDGSTPIVWLHSWGVYLAVYVGFSAWTEASVGLGRLAGIVMPENFDRAHFAYGTADFWRRWNKTLGAWMHEYVYVALGGAYPWGRENRFAWWNVVAVFFAVAFYHHVGGLKLLGPSLALMPAFWVPWLGWASINAVGTLLTRRVHPPAVWRPRDTAFVALTFLISAIGLQVAFYPINLPLRDMGTLLRKLIPG